MTFSKKDAVEMSTKKWEAFANGKGRESDNCGFCEYAARTLGRKPTIGIEGNTICESFCPLYPDICAQYNDYYLDPKPLFWRKRNKKNAQQILDAIKQRGEAWIKEGGNMNKRQAIKECKELWREIEESGLSKTEFLRTPADEKWVNKDYWGDCPLCEYSQSKEGMATCNHCPLVTQYGKNCYKLGFNDDKLSLPSFFKAIRGLK